MFPSRKPPKEVPADSVRRKIWFRVMMTIIGFFVLAFVCGLLFIKFGSFYLSSTEFSAIK